MQNVMAGVSSTAPRLRVRGLKFIVGSLVIAGAIGFFVLSSFGSNVVYYVTLPEFEAQHAQLVGQTIRVNGPLDQSSIQIDQKTLTLKFNLKDGSVVVPVVYHGVVPDTLTTGESVVAEGRLSPQGVFEADNILVKCPSKYEQGKATN
jgi:cytochrome c-type biogenesis protein CcmE